MPLSLTVVTAQRSILQQEGVMRLIVPTEDGQITVLPSHAALMTALAEHILDTALQLANESNWGRLCPPMLACLDELPSTAPLPTLRTRLANE